MPKIHLLDPTVADQIAAGEVVERPSSVVKELVENALDAGATQIRVELEEAGRRLIRVSDNGEGMDADDMALAVRRHATSKIKRTADLLNLASFGFRGEALPSIASVCHFSLSSRTAHSAQGHCLKIEGGLASPLIVDGRAQGTTVEVRHLFFNTPARLKFLRSDGTEGSKVVADLSQISLAHPQVAFFLSQDGRQAMDLRAGQGSERLRQLWGASLSDAALAVEHQEAGLHVRGWVAPPQLARARRDSQWLFVNKRPVEHRQLGYHLSQAFGSLLPHGRHPVAALFLELEPEAVDVNVHPAKREVRFRKDSVVLDALRHAVASALREAKLFTALDLEKSGSQPASSYPAWPSSGGSPVLAEAPAPWIHAVSSPAPSIQASSWSLPQAKSLPLGWPQPLAQLHKTYLLCQDPTGLVLVDQHAAHERILYERHLRSLAAGQVSVQKLLLPQRLSVSSAQAELLRQWMPQLSDLGLELEDVGGGLFFLSSLPSYLKHVQATALLQDLLDRPDTDTQPNSGDPLEDFRREAAAMMACRAAVKAGDVLGFESMQQIMADLAACEIPWSCPHGRPPLVQVSLAELEKYFQRR